MAFKLPKLTTEIDCGPIGYPGLTVTCWLNITIEPWGPPEDGEPWETLFYHGLARIIERVTFPADMTDGDEPEVWEVVDAKALYDLMAAPGFDQSIILWVQGQYQNQRADRLRAELKN